MCPTCSSDESPSYESSNDRWISSSLLLQLFPEKRSAFKLFPWKQQRRRCLCSFLAWTCSACSSLSLSSLWLRSAAPHDCRNVVCDPQVYTWARRAPSRTALPILYGPIEMFRSVLKRCSVWIQNGGKMLCSHGDLERQVSFGFPGIMQFYQSCYTLTHEVQRVSGSHDKYTDVFLCFFL